MARRRFQFSLAALFKLVLIAAVLVTVAQRPENLFGVAMGCLMVVAWIVFAGLFFCTMVAVYHVFEAGFWLCEACANLYRRVLRVIW